MKRYINSIQIAFDKEHRCEILTQCPPKYLESMLDDGFTPVDPDTFEPVKGYFALHDLYNKFICNEIVLAR